MHNIGDCLFKAYAENWELCLVLGHSKAQLKSAKDDLHQKYYKKIAGENTKKGEAKADVMNTSGMVLQKRRLSTMKTVMKMPKIDESDMETVIIKQEESMMKTVMNTKMVMNIPKKEESVMKTVTNTKMVIKIPKKEESVIKTVMNIPKKDGGVIKTVMKKPENVMNNGSYWQKVNNRFIKTTNFEELKCGVMKLIADGVPRIELKMQMEMVQSDRIDIVACNFYPDDGPKFVYPVEMYGDWNCFPRAILKIAFATEENHLEI